MKNIIYIILLALAMGEGRVGATQNLQGYVRVDGVVLRDSLNRQLILRGLNYVNKDKENKHLNREADTAFAAMRKWGRNCVRLGVNWAALEPVPGKYDTIYLKNLDKQVQYAGDNNLYVILDMHQDLYSEKFDNGAPLWATLDEGKPHNTGAIWSDAYFMSPAVQQSFESFWNNRPVPSTATGVQDHYAASWAMLARRYKKCKNIVGYDIMNEPFIGSNINKVLSIYLEEIAKYLNTGSTDKSYTPADVLGMWMSDEGKGKLMKLFNDSTLFITAINSIEKVYSEFEIQKLIPFYKRVAKSIRQADACHILFWEPSVSANNGVRSHLQIIEEAGLQQGLMPHLYDLGLDTDMAGLVNSIRLSILFERLAELRQQLGLPLLLGEWGAFYGPAKGAKITSSIMAAKINQYGFGDTYWSYFKDLPKQDYFHEICRPYATAVNGRLLSFKQAMLNNNVSNVNTAAVMDSISMEWVEDENCKAPTEIILPAKGLIIVNGVSNKAYRILAMEGGFVTLQVFPSMKNIKRNITVSWNNEDLN